MFQELELLPEPMQQQRNCVMIQDFYVQSFQVRAHQHATACLVSSSLCQQSTNMSRRYSSLKMLPTTQKCTTPSRQPWPTSEQDTGMLFPQWQKLS